MSSTEIHAIAHELKFWKDFVKTERFIKGWAGGLRKNPELNCEVYNFIVGLPEYIDTVNRKVGSKFEVLDVGSGVVSILRGIENIRTVVTACDPLWPLYEIIFDYKGHGIEPCRPYAGEDLPYENQFDIVHMSNALDHSEYPGDVFENLFKACRPGGYVIIQSFENEADFEKGEGFHKYNIMLNGKQLEYQYIHDPTENAYFSFDCSESGMKFEVVHATTQKLDTGKNWIIWIAKKL
jgi:SAM-dependent methyltransferase